MASSEISYNGQSPSTPTLRNITINVNLANGVYKTRPTDYTLVVFYARPPNTGSDDPERTYYLYTESLRFTGDLNSLYSVAQVETPDSTIAGDITVNQPLPYSVTLGIPGSGKVTTLQPGQLSVSFKFDLASVTSNQITTAADAKLAEMGAVR